MERELTMSEILTDPLIRVMLAADGISPSDFAEVVYKAAARLNTLSHAPALKERYPNPGDIVWQQSIQAQGEATVEIQNSAFSPLTAAFA